MLNSLLPDRPLEEQLAGEVILTLGGRPYRLPTLSRRQNRAWKAQLEEELGGVLGMVQGANDPATIMAVLSGASDIVVGLVRGYDVGNVIPPDDADALEHDTDQEWMAALLACGAAAYPFVGLALSAQQRAQASPATTTGPEPTSSPPPATAGARTTSRKG